MATIILVRLVVLAMLVGCTQPRPLSPADPSDDDVAAQPRDQTRHYTIWLGGSRVGTAVEHETWTRDGVVLARTETLRFLRGDAEVRLATEITIDASPALVARHVRWSATHDGANSETRAAEATRTSTGWRVSTGEPLPMPAVPAELVPLLVRRDGHFAGDIFLPARGFMTGTGRIDAVAPDRLVARMILAAGTVAEATIDLDSDRTPARVVDGEGVIALRTSAATALEDFPSVDLIAATAIPIAGTRNRENQIILDGNLALPALPGQRALPAEDGLVVALSPALAGALADGSRGPDRSALIDALVTAVQQRIRPDLGVGASYARDATVATAGDCTTFALAYTALATERAIPTRVVTGLRVEGDTLIRHRWAVSWTGTRWIAIDAAFGAVPAGGNLIGLAVHDADDAGLVAGEAALTQVRAARWLVSNRE